MYSGLIGKTTPIVDVLTVLTGVWDECQKLGWHVVMTPFFTCMDKVVDAGSTPIPFEVTVPVPAMLFGKSGNVTAIVIKPGDTAIDFPEPGVAQVQVFGSGTKLKAIR